MSNYFKKGYEPPQDIRSTQDVRDWQMRLGVKVDGIWGPNTAKAYDLWKNLNEDQGMRDTFNNGAPASAQNTMPDYGTMHSGKNDLDYSGLLAKSIETSGLSFSEKTKAKYVVDGLDSEQLSQLYKDVQRDGVETYLSQDAFDRRTYEMFFPEKAREAKLSELAELNEFIDSIPAWEKITALGSGRSPRYEDALRRKEALEEEIGKQVTGDEFLGNRNPADVAQLPWTEEGIKSILNCYKGLETKDLFKVVESRDNKNIYVSDNCQYLIHQGKVYELQSRKSGAQISAPPINSFEVDITKKEFDWAKAISAFKLENPKVKSIYADDQMLSSGNVPASAYIFTLISGLTNAAVNGFKNTTVTVRFTEWQDGKTEARMYLYHEQPLWNNDPNNYGLIRRSEVDAGNVGELLNNHKDIAKFAEQYTGVPSDDRYTYDIYYYYNPQRKTAQVPMELVFTGDGRLAEVFSLLPNERCVIVRSKSLFSKTEIVFDMSQVLTTPHELSQELTDWLLTAFQANL